MINADQRQVYAWDLLLRLFQWILVVAFTIAYFTKGGRLGPHSLRHGERPHGLVPRRHASEL
jgi:cytochrome b